MIAEKYRFSNSNNSKNFLTLVLNMYTANQEDPIMLVTTIKNLCKAFGQISKVCIFINFFSNMLKMYII